MKVTTEELIEELAGKTEKHKREAEKLKQLPFDTLNARPAPGKWSALECIEHLNLYGDYYLPEIEKRLSESNTGVTASFESGWLGNYFAKSMLPKEKLNKMKTFKDKDPMGSDLDVSVLTKFINQQDQMLKLLELARKKDLSRIKTSISITKLIKLRLGDTLRVVIYHNERHLRQAEKATGSA